MAEGKCERPWPVAPELPEMPDPPEMQTVELSEPELTFVRLGPDDEPLFVNPWAVDAVGKYGNGSLVVLRSGKELVAKGQHPTEVMSVLVEHYPEVPPGFDPEALLKLYR